MEGSAVGVSCAGVLVTVVVDGLAGDVADGGGGGAVVVTGVSEGTGVVTAAAGGLSLPPLSTTAVAITAMANTAPAIDATHFQFSLEPGGRYSKSSSRPEYSVDCGAVSELYGSS
ncbi:hypothetical protein I543_3829 [Mycobacteroides abscessus 21]|uniref:Uncharacterized protein n=1 Tax=Mycobacteroides abscessus 21 TaxID=1299324 RepID=A0A829Q8W4_9MYCO|nr:hypothetical protein I543_3829 [Mycobacteroides abscessus 21]SLD05940.1 Uncharacterised protein [Mycobacteroides abscessus subsp. massiliense]